MTPLAWPGPGIEADLLVLRHVFGKDVSSFLPTVGGIGTLAPGILQNNRVMVPPYTTSHAVALTNILEPLEEDGYWFTVTNEGGRFVTKLRYKGQEWQGQSRTNVAEAISIAALKSRGFEVRQ